MRPISRPVQWLLWTVLLVACATERPPAVTVETQSAGADPTFSLPDGFDLQGHRGARGLKPENTLPAFEAALDLGVTTLELDLHYSQDGVVVVWHDPEIGNEKCGLDPAAPPGFPDPDGLIFQGSKLKISNLRFEQLQAYRCDRNPEPDRFPDQDNSPTPLAGDDYGIISLAELFAFVDEYSQAESKSDSQRETARQVQFNIETKRKEDDPGAINDDFDGQQPGPFELAILALIEERQLAGRTIIQSFDLRSLWAIRSVNQEIRLAALTSRGVAQPAAHAARGASIWSPNFNNLTPALLEEAHQSSLLVIPWTVNEPTDMRRLIEMGVDGLISDRPDLALHLE